jgi:hypothetical protein
MNMFCSKCGTKYDEGTKFCKSCGAERVLPQNAPPNAYTKQQQAAPQNVYSQPQPQQPRRVPQPEPLRRRRPPPKQKNPIALYITVAVVAVGLGIGSYFLFFGNANDRSGNGNDYIADDMWYGLPDDSRSSDSPQPDPVAPSRTPEPDDDTSSDDEPPDEPLYNIRELNSQLPRNVLAYANRTLVGLKTDGTVVYAVSDVQGERQLELLRGWSDIVSVYTGARFVSRDEFFGIRSNGTVAYTYPVDGENPILDSWTDIIDLSMDNRIIVGLKSDGTVVGYNGSQHGGDAWIREIESWTNIIEVHALELSWRPVIIGLRADGTVVFTDSGLDLGYLNGVRGWTDIISLHSGYTSLQGQTDRGYIIGLKSDGTVVYTVEEGAYIDSEYILSWTDIIEISASSSFVLHSGSSTQDINVVGLKSDGTVVSTYSIWRDDNNHEFDRRRTSDWENVISISPRILADGEIVLGYFITGNGSASVLSDGTVVLNWSSSAQTAEPEGVENWTDIRTTPVIR